MKPSRIYLRSSKVRIHIEPSTLVHEAAHALHYDLDDKISELWLRKFPPKDNGSRAGALTAYAAIDRNETFSMTTLPEGDAEHNYFSKGKRISFHGVGHTPDRAFRRLRNQIEDLPGLLGSAVQNVTVYPGLDIYGCFVGDGGPASTAWRTVTEDIAVSTAYFHAAQISPVNHTHILWKILNSPKTAERILILADFGFIDDKMALELFSLAREFDRR